MCYKSIVKFLNFNKIFFCFGVFLICFVFVFSIPMFQKPDEGYHYNQILSFVGTIRNFPSFNSTPKIYKIEYQLPEISFSGMIMGSYDCKFPISLYKNGFLLSKNKEIIDTDLNFKFVSLFSYFPQILGYSLNFGFPILGFYMARIFSFLFFLFCIYLSNKIINKKYRNVLLIYCCLPMVWQQVTAVSYDAVFLSLCPLIFSFLTKYFCEKKLEIKDLILFIFLLILIYLVKPGNELFLFLILIFPFEKFFFNFSKLKIFIIKFILFLLVIFCLYLRTSSTVSVSTDINLNQSIQKKMLVSDPKYAINVGLNSLKVNSDFYINSFFGNFGWLDYHFDSWIYVFISIALISFYILMLGKIKKPIVGYKQIISMFVFIFLYIGLSFGVMYFAWTPAASKVIGGVQGRYFLPVVPFFLFALSQLILNIGKEKSKKISFAIFIMIMFVSFMSITYKRYYDYSKLYQNQTELKENFDLINKTPKKIEEVLLNKEINMEISLTDKKFSGFQLMIKLPKEKIVVPYGYSIVNGNNKIIQKGYIPVADLVGDIVFQENFKIKEVNTETIKIKIWPVMIDEKENYISLLKNKDDNSFFVNLLYIRK